ncbi:uncharacterized protein LOC120341454 isoform X2 [Styela clava]
MFQTLSLLLLVSWSNAFDDTPACTQIENLFQTLCARDEAHTSIGTDTTQSSPGKKGPVGGKGEIGRPGPVGPPAIVDYERIETEIDEKIAPVISQSALNINTLTSVIEKLEERIKILESRQGTCEIKFDEKCYLVERLDHFVAGYDKLARIYAERNGSPANIYSEKHYNTMMRFLRAKILTKRDVIAIWVGMRTNPTVNIFLFFVSMRN